MNWRDRLSKELPLLGHRNWIVVADAAYPAQSRHGIETVATGAEQQKVVKAVLAALDRAKHVRPTIYLDSELQHVPEEHARGIEAYRKELRRLLADRPVSVTPHEEIIARLDKAGELFRILILKTKLTLPYTSVFFQLECGYWTAEAERKLREVIRSAE
ncbi:MAG TPA: RbsD/FucU domain-containing protein [Phycisphaerae bacterium]|nr:RbsD/FucU domain-containing protein [Phycisphaerae bacterium]